MIDSRALEHAEAEAFRMLMGTVADASPDSGTEVQDFGCGCASVAPGSRIPLLNRAIAIDHPFLPPVLEWYAKRGVPARFVLSPDALTPEYKADLLSAGLVEQDNPNASRRIMVAKTGPQPTGAADIRPVTTDEEIRAFAQLSAEIWPIVLFQPDRATAAYKSLLQSERVEAFLAHIAGEAAAVGMVIKKDAVGFLANGGTREPMRGKGLQKEMVRRRLAWSWEMGCSHAGSLVTAGSISEANLIKCGFQAVYDRTIWAPANWQQSEFYART